LVATGSGTTAGSNATSAVGTGVAKGATEGDSDVTAGVAADTTGRGASGTAGMVVCRESWVVLGTGWDGAMGVVAGNVGVAVGGDKGWVAAKRRHGRG